MRFNKSLALFRLTLRSSAHTKGFARRVRNQIQDQIVLMFTLVFLYLGFRGSGCVGGLTLDMCSADRLAGQRPRNERVTHRDLCTALE